MHVTCPACNESFTLDDARAKNVRLARCVCGANIDLRSVSSGQQFGKYFLQERIAAGGMGEVYRAKISGVEGFERPVAIKKMLPHLSADRDFIAMLVKEAKLSVLLHHQNIVQVYDLAKEGNEYYIAMEYVPSVNLSNLLEHCATNARFLPIPVAVSVMLQVLQGLSYAHTLCDPDGQPMNILHRDITPQNILITKEGWVKITDFGIAKAKNEISTTRPGTIRGKLGYVAPEQLRTKDADQRVDIFCAGIVLWESLATRRLFKGEDEIDTLRLIVETHVPALPALRRDVSSGLDAVVHKALAKDLNERYETAAAFHDALLAAIKPASADDYAKATRRFFATMEALFHREGDTSPPENPTVALDEVAPRKRIDSVTITDLVSKPRSTKRMLAIAAGFLLVIAAVIGIGLWRSARQPAPPPMTSAEVQAAIDSAREQILACYKAPLAKDTEARARLSVQADGRITDVSPTPPSLGAARSCLTETITPIRMRAHAAQRFETTVDLPMPAAADPEPAPAPRQQTKAPTPSPRASRPLTPEEIERTVVGSFGLITRCLAELKPGTVPKTITLQLEIRANGRVDKVALNPALDAPAATRCLNNAVRSLRFRPSSKAVQINLPLHLETYTPKP